MMWLLLKFHFDDVYFDRAVPYLEEAEIDVEGRMYRKRNETGLDSFFDI